MAVMMQAFYWDAPSKENKRGEWWNHIAERVPQLASSGIDALWLPPFSKAASGESNGYDPYDYFDLGDLDQGFGENRIRQSRRASKTYPAFARA
jgi:alpha-amylase